MGVITYPCGDWSQSVLVKGVVLVISLNQHYCDIGNDTFAQTPLNFGADIISIKNVLS